MTDATSETQKAGRNRGRDGDVAVEATTWGDCAW
jgi:hypothetical protein